VPLALSPHHGSCLSLAQVSGPVTARYFGFNRCRLAETVNEEITRILIFPGRDSSTVGVPIVGSPQLVLSAGFKAMASPTAELRRFRKNCLHLKVQ